MRALKSQAVRTIEKGDYEPAEVLLSKIEDAHLAAAERLQAQAEERFLSAARTRAERAQLRRGAVRLFGGRGPLRDGVGASARLAARSQGRPPPQRQPCLAGFRGDPHEQWPTSPLDSVVGAACQCEAGSSSLSD